MRYERSTWSVVQRVAMVLTVSMLSVSNLLFVPATAHADSLQGKIVYSAYDGAHYAIEVANLDGTNSSIIAEGLDPSLSENGQKVAYVDGTQEDYIHHLHLVNADGSNDVSIAPDDDYVRVPALSPDATKIAFDDSSGHIITMNIDGTNRHMLSSNSSVPSWSPDGSQIAFARGNAQGGTSLAIANSDGSNERIVYFPGENNGFSSPTWSPDGAWIAFVAPGGLVGQVYTVRPDGSGLKQITNYYDPTVNNGAIRSISWSPDSSRVLFDVQKIIQTPGNIWNIYWDVYSAGITDLTAPLETITLPFSDDHVISTISTSGPVFDTTPPVITVTADPTPNAQGWNNTYVALNWTVTDPETGIKEQDGCRNQAVGYEGVGVTYSCTVTSTGGTSTKSIVLNTDLTGPQPAAGIVPAWTNNPKTLSGTGSTATLTVTGTDNLSGIANGEYYIGLTDPGQGNGTPMTLSNTRTNPDGTTSSDLSTSFGTGYAAGLYPITVRAKDAAGNWGIIATTDLVVFDQTGPTDVAGSKQIIPSPSQGDYLPGISSAGTNDKAGLDFDVSHTATGAVAPSSYVKLGYSVGNGCKNHPERCISTDFTANMSAPNVINLLAITGGNTVGTSQGIGTLTINDHGSISTSLNPFKLVATVGNPDSAIMYIYATGDNPDTGTAIYQLHVSADGNFVRIQ